MGKAIALTLGALVLLASVSAFAHHPFSSEFDKNKPVTLSGTVTRVEWAKPHAYIYMDVKNDSGRSEKWKLEAPAPITWRSSPVQEARAAPDDGVRSGRFIKFRVKDENGAAHAHEQHIEAEENTRPCVYSEKRPRHEQALRGPKPTVANLRFHHSGPAPTPMPGAL
jgi:Family of unknown function (DUF6152)